MIRHSKLFLLIFLGFALGTFISICLQVQAGSLTPSGTPASTNVGTIPVSDIVGSGYVTSTDSLHQLSSVIQDNGMTANSGMYNNRIIAMNPPAAYTEVCFKSGSTYYDARSAGVATGGGNCSVGDVGYVIEKNQRATQHWNQAKSICLQNGMRLPETFELQYVCESGGSWGLTGVGSAWEWSGNSSLIEPSGNGLGSAVFGGSGCTYAGWGWVGYLSGLEDSDVFRCAR